MRKNYKIILHPIFSNLSRVYAYLIVEFSEDKYHNFVQNMDNLHQCFEQPKNKSSLNHEFSRLKDERRESPSNFTKSENLQRPHPISQICTSFNMSLSHTVLETESTIL